MSPFWIPVLLASLGGSLHCAAMCGPFVAAVTGFGPSGRTDGKTQAAYHLGRLVTYLGLGAFAGLVGGALDFVAGAAGIGRISAVVAGSILVFSGISTLVARPSFMKLGRRAPSRLGTLLGRALAVFARFPPLQRAWLLGLSTTLVPCGWLYAFVAVAAGTGNVPSALGVMLVFWLGTLPALVAAGLGLRGLFLRLGSRSRAVSAALVAVSGLVLIGLRIELPRPAESGVESAGLASAGCPLHRH